MLSSPVSGLWISVHDDACPPTTTLVCGVGTVTLPVTASGSYPHRIARSAAAATGGSTLTFAEYAAPANDTCEAVEAAPAVVAGEYPWDDGGASANAPFPSCGTASSATQARCLVQVSGRRGRQRDDLLPPPPWAPGQNTEATMAVFSSCTGPQLACGSASPPTDRRWACFPVTSGQTYIIRVSRPATAA